ncbi:MAG: hypothetical protein ACTSXY_04240 [Promethearchaeota archaeon]
MMIETYKELTEAREIYWMIKENYLDEFEHYCSIIEKYEELIKNNDDFCCSTFIAKEILEIMKKYKIITKSNPIYTEFMDKIVKNTLILLQSFYPENQKDCFKHFSQMNIEEQELIKNRLLVLIQN